MQTTDDQRALKFKAVGSEVRRAILSQLLHHDVSPVDVAAANDMTITGAEKHLKILELAGFITRYRFHRRNMCHLNQEALSDIADWPDLLEVDWMDSFLL